MKLTDDNIELYLFRYKEGLLDAAETAEVEKALASHPDWQAMADLYDPSLTLPAGASLHYDNWQSLRDGGPAAQRKPLTLASGTRKRNVKPMWLSIAAAACLLLFVTSVIKLADVPMGTSLQPVVAGVRGIDTIRLLQDTLIESDMRLNSPKATVRYASAVRHQEGVLLAAAEVTAEPAAAATESNNVESPQVEPMPDGGDLYLAAKADGYGVDVADSADLGNASDKDLDNAMQHEIFYSQGIITRREAGNTSETPATRGEQLRSLARRATGLAANISASHRQRREALEENIENNEFFSNLIATIE